MANVGGVPLGVCVSVFVLGYVLTEVCVDGGFVN